MSVSSFEDVVSNNELVSLPPPPHQTVADAIKPFMSEAGTFTECRIDLRGNYKYLVNDLWGNSLCGGKWFSNRDGSVPEEYVTPCDPGHNPLHLTEPSTNIYLAFDHVGGTFVPPSQEQIEEWHDLKHTTPSIPQQVIDGQESSPISDDDAEARNPAFPPPSKLTHPIGKAKNKPQKVEVDHGVFEQFDFHQYLCTTTDLFLHNPIYHCPLPNLNDLDSCINWIFGHKVVNGARYFLVYWQGYPRDESTWEFEGNLLGCERRIQNWLDWFEQETREKA